MISFAVISTLPPPVVTLPDAPKIKSPTPLAVLPSASRVRVPVPSRVMAALMLMSLPARSTTLTLLLPVEVARFHAALTVMSLVACSSMVPVTPAKLPLPAVTSKLLVSPASSAKASVWSEPTVKPAVFESAEVVIVMFNGSSNSVPSSPLAALRSISLAWKSRLPLPETSANPPSPPATPPVANTEP